MGKIDPIKRRKHALIKTETLEYLQRRRCNTKPKVKSGFLCAHGKIIKVDPKARRNNELQNRQVTHKT